MALSKAQAGTLASSATKRQARKRMRFLCQRDKQDTGRHGYR